MHHKVANKIAVLFLLLALAFSAVGLSPVRAVQTGSGRSSARRVELRPIGRIFRP